VVEDQPSTRFIVAEALSQAGYLVDQAASGEQALARLGSAAYDLMLLDLRMPGIDGLAVMVHVQESHPDLLVIILTAYATLESAIAAVKAGASDYLLKPVSMRDIEAAVTQALERRRESLRQRHLIGVIAQAVEALQTADQDPQTGTSPRRQERFLQCGTVSLDMETRAVVIAGDQTNENHLADLTNSQAAIPAHLMQHPDTTFTCRRLAEDVFGYLVGEREADQIVRPHISRLRRKIEPDPSHPRIIRTVVGKGYLFSTG
jgi:two-component system KDP operon response regulator KdpE